MKPTTTYRIVAIHTDDGSRRLLCDNMREETAAQRIAESLKGCIPFATIVVENEDAPLVQPGRDAQLSP